MTKSEEKVAGYLANQSYDYPDDDIKDLINRGIGWESTFRSEIKSQEKATAKKAELSDRQWKNFTKIMKGIESRDFGKIGADKVREYETYAERVKEIPVEFRDVAEEWIERGEYWLTRASTELVEEEKISRIVTTEEEYKSLTLTEKQHIGRKIKTLR